MLIDILNSNDIKVVGKPVKKQQHPKNKDPWILENYYINKDGQIIDNHTNMATNKIDKMVSWSNTLAYLVAELNKNNIPFKQSKMFKDTNAKWDSPLAMSDLAASRDLLNDKSIQFNSKGIYKHQVIELYNSNP